MFYQRRNSKLDRRLAALVVATASLLGSWAQAQPHPLVQRASEEGTIRVIVELRAQHVPEGELPSSDAVSGQRRAIGRVRERVLDRAAAFGTTGVRRFQTIPYTKN